MTAYIHCIETLLPLYSASQTVIARQMALWSADPITARLIRHVFQRAGIEKRHSVIPDFTLPEQAELFRVDSEGRVLEPSTQERNRCFQRHSGPMAVELAQRLLDDHSEFGRDQITHVITVSCTGFANPGADYHIVTGLGLPAGVQRYHLGFMGCYAALPALRMAQQFCLAQPDAVVLIICLEFCSLHMQMKSTQDSILANALFSDGAAAVLVSARQPDQGRPALALNHFSSAIAAKGVGDMAWEIGDRGFNLVLSSYVPDVIASNVGRTVGDLLSEHGMTASRVPFWAIHPGGRAILDKVEDSLALEPWQIEVSREVLRDCGNMSSVTILFVLQRMLAKHCSKPADLVAMAFGPGLTIESGLFQIMPAQQPTHAREDRPEPLVLCQ